MSESVRWTSGRPGRQEPRGTEGANLADILERVLDKGIVIAGDIQVNLLDIELLTIKIRLVVASVDRAKEMGIDWWERDPTLSAGRQELEDENDELRSRIAALESAMGGTAALSGGAERSEGDDEAVRDEDDDPDRQDGDPPAEPPGRERGPAEEPAAETPPRTRAEARPARRRAAAPADRAGARRRNRDR